MEEMLLTDEEIQGIIKRGYVAHAPLGQPECRKAIDREIARAQVRKVVEWMQQNNVAPLRAKEGRTYASNLVLRKEDWAALKAAGDER